MANLQINILNNCCTHLKRASVPNFRGGTIPVRQNDTVEIKGKENKRQNIGIILLGGLGIGAAIFALVKLHKTSAIKSKEELTTELKEIQQICKDIFKRDINAEETKDFVKRYKKIIESKTSDNDREYCEKLLDEICKDRQTKRPEIHGWIKNKADADPRCVNGGMATSPDGTYIDIYSFNYRNKENPAKEYFESLFHETHHVKQNEIVYRTDKEFFMQHLLDKFIDNGNGKMYKDILRANHGDKEKTLNEIKEGLSAQVNNYLGNLAPFEKNSADYQEGLGLIEGMKNYKFFGDCKTHEEYRNQIIEKGAYADGERAMKLFDLLKKINI